MHQMQVIQIFIIISILIMNLDALGICRWTAKDPSETEPLLYVKQRSNIINIWDVTKNIVYKKSVRIASEMVRSMDVCSEDGNLLILGTQEGDIMLFDKRKLQVVTCFQNYHSGEPNSKIKFKINILSFAHV
jgi:WD40 repeat protein